LPKQLEEFRIKACACELSETHCARAAAKQITSKHSERDAGDDD